MLKKIDIKEKINFFAPYLATFYYVEIVYMMIFLNFLYGKIFAVSAGLLFTFFLTFHIIRLFNKIDINRKIQLYLNEIRPDYLYNIRTHGWNGFDTVLYARKKQ